MKRDQKTLNLWASTRPCDACGEAMDNDFSNYCNRCRERYMRRTEAETTRTEAENLSIDLGR